jgi:ABC-type transport system involved in multi-copper enzyme maturation permease subunit
MYKGAIMPPPSFQTSGSISPVHLGAAVSGPMAVVPVVVVVFYLVVPIVVAAIVFRKRDMLGAS